MYPNRSNYLYIRCIGRVGPYVTQKWVGGGGGGGLANCDGL